MESLETFCILIADQIFSSNEVTIKEIEECYFKTKLKFGIVENDEISKKWCRHIERQIKDIKKNNNKKQFIGELYGRLSH